MESFAEKDLKQKGNYIKTLKLIAGLSRLFSENSVPYLQYRIAENVFCKSFNAENLSRKDNAFDAKIDNLGIGIKTFICEGNSKMEKIAEFNKDASTLKKFSRKKLAIQLAIERNKRINSAKELDGIEKSIYHIIVRKENKWLLFETDYDEINIKKIDLIKQTEKSLQFTDGSNSYIYNFSKSTLYRKFEIPPNSYIINVEIAKDPYISLLKISNDENLGILQEQSSLIKGEDYIILPLYSYKKNLVTKIKEKYVFPNSGINQWNAKPRKGQIRRDPGEVYIPIPITVHKSYPNFFPPNMRGNFFTLQVPTGEIFKAKTCQTSKIEIEGKKINKGKGLMTNPNKNLSIWLLRGLLQLKEEELATIEKLNDICFDSVVIYKKGINEYKIDKARFNSFEDFIQEE